MKKALQNQINGGLADLLNVNPAGRAAATQQGQAPETSQKVKVTYKTVCYNLDPAIIEAVKNIAYWDRKKCNAVVTEAMEQYIKKWKSKNGEIAARV